MNNAKELGTSKMTIAPDVYHFYPDKAFNPLVLSAEYVAGLTFSNNTISRSGNFIPSDLKKLVIEITHSKEVKLKDNKINSGFMNTLQMDDFTKDNAVITE